MDSVADRYAVALLSVSREENKIQEYIDEVEQIISVFEKNSDLGRILKDYGLTKDEKKDVLDLCFKNKINQYILNTLYVVIDNKRGAICQEVLEEFVRLAYKDLNIKKGIVYSTIKLTKKEIEQIENKVSKIINAKVILVNKLDANIVGGFKIQVEDFIIDQTIQKRLDDLKTSLLKKERDI